MTVGGWIFMLSSVGFVLWLTGYCFWKVLRKPVKSGDARPVSPPPI